MSQDEAVRRALVAAWTILSERGMYERQHEIAQLRKKLGFQPPSEPELEIAAVVLQLLANKFAIVPDSDSPFGTGSSDDLDSARGIDPTMLSRRF